MTDSGPSGSRRRKRNRRGRPNGAPGANRFNNRGRNNRQHSELNFHSGMPKEFGVDETSVLGGRTPVNGNGSSTTRDDGPLDGFKLFCAFHLGITPDDRYREPTLNETANRFGVEPQQVEALLVEHKVDMNTMSRTDFDLMGAKLDVRVAPEGISRTEIAREHYENYLECLDND